MHAPPASSNQPLCRTCRVWSQRHGGADPNGRPGKRARAALLADIRALSLRSTTACVILPGYKVRPKVLLDGKQVSASRAAWIMEHGDPGALWVLHTCHRGEEGCILLAHLYLGTPDRNSRDMAEAGRAAVTGAKLSPAQVEEIKRRYRKGNRWRPGNRLALAAEYGVTEKTIRNAVRGQSWESPSAQRLT